MNRPLLELRTLSVGYRAEALVLKEVDLTLGAGLTVLIGVNGAGKSTLLRTIATAIPPILGDVVIENESVKSRSGLRAARQSIGYVPQHPDFPGNYLVEEFLYYGAKLRRAEDARAAVGQAVQRFELSELMRRPLSKLSGGQHQRVFLAEATLADPAVVLLDEPSSGLDIPTRKALLAELERQAETRCVVFTSHLVEDISTAANHVVVVGNGTVRDVGSGTDVVRASRHLGTGVAGYLSMLLGAV